VPEVFPREFYEELVSHLPERDAYAPISDVRPVTKRYGTTRSIMMLRPEAVAKLPERARTAWDHLGRTLFLGEFTNMLLYRFKPLLEERFGNVGNVEFYHEGMLVRDDTGYDLGPHTDAPRKVISALFYLPRDASRPHLGTSIYVPTDRQFTCPGTRHHPFDDFERVRTMPYVPNAMFAFLKTANSFHGVEPVAEANAPRDLLLYDIYHRESATRPTMAPAAAPAT